MGSNPTVSARKQRYVEVYRHSAAFYSPDADSIFLALPPAFGKFCGQGQGFFHCGGAQLFRLGIQMGVDVRRGGDIAVTQPFLDLFHGHPLFQQQAGAGVPLRYNKDKRKNPVFSRVSAFVVAYSIPFPTLIANEKSVE